MPEPSRRTPEAEPRATYLLVVARDRPDLLARARQLLEADSRIEVIVDRRLGERRMSGAGPPGPERRRADRRRPATSGTSLDMHPTILARKRAEFAAEVHDRIAAISREREELRATNARLHEEIADLDRRLKALATVNIAIKRELSAVLAEAERTLKAVRQRPGASRDQRSREDDPGAPPVTGVAPGA